MASIVACYAIYMIWGPAGDGAVFGTLMLTLGLLGGLKIQELLKNDGTDRLR